MTADRPFSEYTSRVLAGHRKEVYSLAWSSNGKRLASGGGDYNVRVWSVDAQSTGKAEKSECELQGHSEAVTNVCWSRDPNAPDRLASSAHDKTVRFWDARSSRAAGTVSTVGQPLNLAWSYDGTVLAVGNKEDDVSFIDTRRNKVLKTHKNPPQVNELAWSKDGKFFYQAVMKGIEVLRYLSMERVRLMQGHTDKVMCLAIDNRERYIASGGQDALISLWDYDSLACLRTIIGFDQPVRGLSFSHGSRYLAYSAGSESGIQIEDLEEGVTAHQIPTKGFLDCLSWNPKYPLLAYNGGPTDSRTWDPNVVSLFAPPASKS